MSSLLTPDQKTQVHNVLDLLHDTFARDIVIYKRTDGSVAIAIDKHPVYSTELDGQNPDSELSSTTISARIKYIGNQSESDGSNVDGQFGIKFPLGGIRLKVNDAGFNLIRDCQRLEVDGELYEQVTDAARTGPFVASYYIIYLKRME